MMPIHQSKIDALQAYSANPGDWEFESEFAPPVDVSQAMIIFALYVWHGSNEKYVDGNMQLRFHTSLIQICLDTSYLKPFLDKLNIQGDVISEPHKIHTIHKKLFDQKVKEKLISVESSLENYASARDGYIIGHKLSLSDVGDTNIFDEDVRALFSDAAAVNAMRSYFGKVTCMKSHDLIAKLDELVRLSGGVVGEKV